MRFCPPLASCVWQKSKEGQKKRSILTALCPGHHSHCWNFKNVQKFRTKPLIICVLAVHSGLCDMWCKNHTSLLTLVCEYGVTSHDGWSNYVHVRPLWHSTPLAPNTLMGCPWIWTLDLWTWNCTKSVFSTHWLSVFLFLRAHPECWNKDKK